MMEHAHNIAEQSRNLPLFRIWLQLSIWQSQREREGERVRERERDGSCDCGASYQTKLENWNSAKFYFNREKANSLLTLRNETNISTSSQETVTGTQQLSFDANDFAQLVLPFCCIGVIRTDRQTDLSRFNMEPPPPPSCLCTQETVHLRASVGRTSIWYLKLDWKSRSHISKMCAEWGEQKPKH